MYTVRSACTLLIMMMLVCARSTHAAEAPFSVTAMMGVRNGGELNSLNDATVNLNGNTSYALSLTRPAAGGGLYELFYSRHTARLSSTAFSGYSDMQIEHLLLGGITFVDDGEGIEPFIAANLGVTRFSTALTGLRQPVRGAFSLASGITAPITDHLSLRFEVRGYLTWITNKSHFFCADNTNCLLHSTHSTLLQYDLLGGATWRF